MVHLHELAAGILLHSLKEHLGVPVLQVDLVAGTGLVLARWLIGHSIAGVSDLQPHGDQLVPLANLLTVVLVSFRVFLFLQVVMLSRTSQLNSAHNESWEVPRILNAVG